ncbi:hypothetical protein [Fulvivirga lutimaris]|uniref:hypothetical protein n=1 Tax=Fulvivirga lutimaris TaxID=1819566 RepID=UPI0012BC0849|nr:hypothetical protein [Fulvivirga lutimaris]MTI38507.1 hypothetical protein [Fulvivirga lutimaris]
MKYTSYFFIFILLVAGCSDSELEPDQSIYGYEYFPLATGTYQVFEVTQTDYLNTGEVVTSDFQIRHEIAESFVSDEQETFIINRFTRANENDDWEYLNTWQSRRTEFNAIVSEENLSLLKLVFPIEAGVSWNGNSFNSLEEDTYVLDSLSFPFRLNDQGFENTITVIQADNQDFIVSLDTRFEIYAKDIGLVYKEIVNLNYCADENCLGQEIVETGIEYRQALLEYGAL